MQQKTDNYQKLNLVYSHLMKKVRYDFWADYMLMLVKDLIIKNPRVLEIGSGNCKLAHHLNKFYKYIIASDLSFNMLNSSENKKLCRVCCDMNILPFKSDYDLVISCFDTINYLTTKKKLLYFFNQIAKLLTKNGIFVFDVSLENNSILHSSENKRTGRYKGINYVHYSIYEQKKRIHKNKFEIIMKNKKTFKETHIQKIYPFEDYFKLLEKAGLYVVECFKAFTFYKANSDSKRAQFIVRKMSTENA